MEEDWYMGGFIIDSICAVFQFCKLFTEWEKDKRNSQQIIAHIDKCTDIVEVKEEHYTYYTYKAKMKKDNGVVENVMLGEEVRHNQNPKYSVDSDVKIYWNMEKDELFDSQKAAKEVRIAAIAAIPGGLIILFIFVGGFITYLFN